ncbi:hypothetical protein RHSIM_Rhsim03G0044900 [Rhododendron simsii]|uniref:Protein DETOXIFICATION n=1 Tax=Rhododendron simsii TaxID=118357 RepID=A0A834H470_RHOSS|nr:hypothetical protein RHSIM_Rhsim03G0044900 [Rhododendron simsii]
MGSEITENLLTNGEGPEEEEKLKDKLWIEAKKMWVVAGPAIFTRFSNFGTQVIGQAFMGHIGSTELAAYALVATVIVRFSNGILGLPPSEQCDFLDSLELWYNTVLILLTGNMANAEVAIDALAICLNINGWEMMISLGFLAAASVRVSNELGRGSSKAAKFAIVNTVLTSFLIGVVLFVLCLIFRGLIAYIFTENSEVVAAVASLSDLLAWSILLNSVQPVLSGVAIGAGWQSIVAFVNLGCYYLVGVPVGAVLGYVFDFQVKGVWIGMMFGTFVQTVVLLIITCKTDWDKQFKAETYIMGIISRDRNMDNSVEERLLGSEEEGRSDLKWRVWVESKKIWRVAAPGILARVSSFGLMVVTQSFIGHISELDLAAYALVQSLTVRLELWYNSILVLIAGYMSNAEIAISAFSICLNVSAWQFMMCLGFLGASCVRVANELGRGDAKAVKFSIMVVLATSVLLGLVFCILCLIFGSSIGYVFSSNEEVIETVADLSVFLALSMLFNSIQPVLTGVAVGAGLQGTVAIINLCCYYVIGIPIGVLLAYVADLEVKGIWIGMLSGIAMQILALSFMVWRTDWELQVSKASERLNRWFLKPEEPDENLNNHA